MAQSDVNLHFFFFGLFIITPFQSNKNAGENLCMYVHDPWLLLLALIFISTSFFCK